MEELKNSKDEKMVANSVVDRLLKYKDSWMLPSKITAINRDSCTIYVKVVTTDELDINLKLSAKGICPQVLAHRQFVEPRYGQSVDRAIMVSRRYRITLFDYCKSSRIGVGLTPAEYKFIDSKIGKLHDAGYGHGDLHLDNIVIDIDGDAKNLLSSDLKIIDFGTTSLLGSSFDNRLRGMLQISSMWSELKLVKDSTMAEFDLAYYRRCVMDLCKVN